MKNILAILVLILSFSSFAQDEVIEHDDELSQEYLKINIDGLELWDIKNSERAAAISAFENRCYEEIPARIASHWQELENKFSFFKQSELTRKNSIKSMNTRRGKRLLCQTEIEIKENALFYFEMDYSKIFWDKVNGTFNLCKDLISEIDRSLVREGVLTRRAYYYYEQRRGKPFFPACQTMAVRITPYVIED